MELKIGSIFNGKLKVTGLIGRGAMGVVYRVEHVWTHRIYALKLMIPSELNSRKRFQREVATLGSIEHANVVQIHDAGIVDDQPYMTMELLPGFSLEQLLVEQGPQLDLARALWIAWNIAQALAEVHAASIVHRDLKPPNIQILDPDGAEPRVKVLDFGISTTLRPSTKLTGTTTALGTPQYMSPEQALAGEVDSRSDMYALGALLYEMIAGRAPFDNERPLVIATQQIHAPVPDISQFRADVPPDVVAILKRCLQKHPGDRYRATAELRDACAAAYARLDDDDDACDATVQLVDGDATLVGASAIGLAAPLILNQPLPEQTLPDPAPTRPISAPQAIGTPAAPPDRGRRESPQIEPQSTAPVPQRPPPPRPPPAPQPAPRRSPRSPRQPRAAAGGPRPVPAGYRGPQAARQVAPAAPAPPPPARAERTLHLPALSFPDPPREVELSGQGSGRFWQWFGVAIVLTLAAAAAYYLIVRRGS